VSTDELDLAVYLNVNDTTGTARTLFFDMNTSDSAPARLFQLRLYQWQQHDFTGAGSVRPIIQFDGTIILKADLANVLSFNDITGDISRCRSAFARQDVSRFKPYFVIRGALGDEQPDD